MDGEVTSAGAMLAAARQAKGLELADIARDTRVPLRHLRAIEAGAQDQLPALIYALGFVRAYARAVGVDAEIAAGQFRRDYRGATPAPTLSVLAPDASRRPPSALLVGGSVAVVVAVIVGLSAWSAGLFDPPAAMNMATAVAEPMSDAALADGDAAAGLSSSGPVPAVTDAPAPATDGTVVLTAREDVWVKIADPAAPQSFRTGILAAGEVLPLPAGQTGLKLWTGRAGAIAVSVGGRELPPLGGSADRLRGLALTPAALIAHTTPGPPPPAPASPVSTNPASGSAVAGAAAPGAAGSRPIATVPRPRAVVPPAPAIAIDTPAPGGNALTSSGTAGSRSPTNSVTAPSVPGPN